MYIKNVQQTIICLLDNLINWQFGFQSVRYFLGIPWHIFCHGEAYHVVEDERHMKVNNKDLNSISKQ